MSQSTRDPSDSGPHSLSQADLEARVRELEAELAARDAEIVIWQQRCDEVMKIVSHDLRGPLTLASGYSQGLVARLAAKPPNEQASVLAISQATYRLDKMIAEVVDCTRLDTHQLGLSFNTVNLGLILKDVTRKVGRHYRDRVITLDIPRRLPPIWGDPKRIGQVIGTLISNAVVFSRDPASVEIGVARQEGRVVVRVADGGVGIDDDEMAHLFERHYRPERLRDIRREGLGLSLTIAQGLATKLNAHLVAESPGAERGATFYFSLPLTTSDNLQDLAEYLDVDDPE